MNPHPEQEDAVRMAFEKLAQEAQYNITRNDFGVPDSYQFGPTFHAWWGYTAAITSERAKAEKLMEALEKAKGGLAAASAMLPWGGKLLSMAHSAVDEASTAVIEALADWWKGSV